MIELRCLKCGNVSSIPETSVGQTVTCPGCGNVNVAPAAVPAAAGPAVAPPVAYADAPAEVKTWAMLCHLSGLAGFLIPGGWIVGPLVVWLIKGKEHPFIDSQGKEALNFQISMMIYAVASLLLIFVVIGIFTLIAVGIVDLVFVIIASMRANSGQPYRYPLTIRFVK
jgi:hypothetical protein